MREPSTITHRKRAKHLLAVLLRCFWSDEHRSEKKYLDKRGIEISSITREDRLKELAEEFPQRYC